jgi:lipooligosaccharide transport system permease protein
LSVAVDLVRPLFLDRWPEHALRHGLVLALFAGVSFWVALALTRKRFTS